MTEDPLDLHLNALGGALERGVARAERRRRRYATGALTAAALAVGLGALVAIPGGRELDPVAEARAAIATRGELLHYVMTYEFIGPNGPMAYAGGGDPPATEVWTATDGPDRYRFRSPADGRPKFCSGVVTMSKPNGAFGPALVSPMESSQDGRTSTRYSVFSRAAIVTTDPVRRPKQHLGSGVIGTPDFGVTDPRDPVRVIQRALRTGQLRDAGMVTVRGRTLRKLVGSVGRTRRVPDEVVVVNVRTGERTRKRQSKDDLIERPVHYTYLVDSDTFAPVELRTRRFSLWSRAGGRAHQRWTTEIQRFSTFEYLDDTPTNRRLLSIDLPAQTTVYRETSPDKFSPPFSSRQPPKADRAAQRRCKAAMR